MEDGCRSTSTMLHPPTSEALREILPEEHQYEAALDRFEYLLGLGVLGFVLYDV